MAHQSPHECLALILEKREAGYVDEAIAQLQDLLKSHPQFAKGWLELGSSWRIKNDLAQACACYHQILDFAPNNIWAHLQLAQELLASGDDAGAQLHLQTAADKHPNNPLPLVRLGELASAQQQINTAIHWFDQAIQIDPTHPEAYLKKAAAFLSFQDFNAAYATLDILFQHHPQHFWGQFQRGKIAQQQGDHIQALHWFRQAYEVAPNASRQRDAQLWMLEEMSTLQYWEEAKALGAELIAQRPHHLPTLQRYGAILYGAGDVLDAIAVCETILNCYPDQLRALATLGDCASDLGQRSPEVDALKRIETRVELLWQNHNDSPSLVHCLLRLGERYQQHGDWQTAQLYFYRILELAPHHLWANLKVAIAERNAGDLDTAVSRLQRTLQHHPQHVELLVHLGQTEQQRQQFEVALNYFQQAAEVKPDRLDIHLRIVEVLRESQQLVQAQTYLQALQNQHPDDARVLIHRGLYDRALEQRQQALAQFRLAHMTALQQPDHLDPIYQAHWLLIEELRALGQLDIAQQEIETAPNLFQQHVRTQLLLGSLWQRQQALDAAVTIYQQVLQQHPDHVYATIELARCWSQLGKESEAIALLQGYADRSTPHPNVLHLLAQLHQSLENFEQAQLCYQRALKTSAYHAGLYCGGAECLFQQGESDRAISMLIQAQTKLPQAVPISVKLAQILQRQGDVDQSYAILEQTSQQFPGQAVLLVEQVQLHIRCGRYDEAIALLDTITTDHHDWSKRMLNQRGEIALLQLDLNQAEKYYMKAIALHPPQQHERLQLARIHLLQGDLDTAYNQLEQATQDLEKRCPPGQVGLPIKNHIGTIINEFYLNPLRFAQLKDIQQEEEGRDRLLSLATIISEEPTYLGAIITLAKELHLQGIWADLRSALSIKQPRGEAIPKRIIQFWDDPKPPSEVEKLGKTWLAHHPDYQYKRFSLREAIAFLQQHYDSGIINAFRICNHPAAQADFFRLAYLNCYGGFYADADDRCRRSLEPLRQTNADLVLYHEDFACFGNNFLGSVPHHPMIRSALYQAATNLLEYSAEWTWSQTGPGLLTNAVCSGLLPYLPHDDYRLWPQLLVLSRGELSNYVWSHVPLSYKRTEKSWQNQAYPKMRFDHAQPLKRGRPKLGIF